MNEVKVEHVLILAIVAFLLYHFIGRCRCNSFRVGGNEKQRALESLDECERQLLTKKEEKEMLKQMIREADAKEDENVILMQMIREAEANQVAAEKAFHLATAIIAEAEAEAGLGAEAIRDLEKCQKELKKKGL